ncbi:hypothetical protein Tco_0003683 [Tanacetum coccineum]
MDFDHGFVHLEELRLLANSRKLRDLLLIYFNMKTQSKVHLATEIKNLTRQLVDSLDEKCSFIQEIERVSGNVMAYKTREGLKGLQTDNLIKAMDMRTIALRLHLQALKGVDFHKSL